MSERIGRPQGGMKSEAGQAAYWRMQWESAVGALADLIAEHTQTVEECEASKADLWDEGFEAGHTTARAVNPKYPHDERNPYRAERMTP